MLVLALGLTLHVIAGYCDATVGCTGFTYAGAVDGNGAGTCLLRNASPIGLVPSDSYHIGAVKAANYGFQVTTTYVRPIKLNRGIPLIALQDHDDNKL